MKGLVSHSGPLSRLWLPFFLVLGLAGLGHGRGLRDMVSEYKELVRENRAQGRDVSEAVDLADRAKKANDAGDRAKAETLIQEPKFEKSERLSPSAVEPSPKLVSTTWSVPRYRIANAMPDACGICVATGDEPVTMFNARCE